MDSRNKILLSIVVPTYNNPEEFEVTLLSIHKNFSNNIQVIIVDGGSKPETESIISNVFGSVQVNLKYIRDSAKGVFPAQNLGIMSCEGEWVQILNSGDLLAEGAREILNFEYLNGFEEFNILVFCQEAYSDDKKKSEYLFVPNSGSIWPHQSVLVRKSVYNEFGLYREDYKYGAEQYFFAVVRRKTPFTIINKTLSLYKLGGISSRMSIQHCKEIYEVKRELGQGILVSAYFAFISPFARILLEKFLDERSISRIKRRLFKYYR